MVDRVEEKWRLAKGKSIKLPYHDCFMHSMPHNDRGIEKINVWMKWNLFWQQRWASRREIAWIDVVVHCSIDQLLSSLSEIIIASINSNANAWFAMTTKSSLVQSMFILYVKDRISYSNNIKEKWYLHYHITDDHCNYYFYIVTFFQIHITVIL